MAAGITATIKSHFTHQEHALFLLQDCSFKVIESAVIYRLYAVDSPTNQFKRGWAIYLAHFCRATQSLWARLRINVLVLWTLKCEDIEAKKAAKVHKPGCVQGSKINLYPAGKSPC